MNTQKDSVFEAFIENAIPKKGQKVVKAGAKETFVRRVYEVKK